MIPAHKHPMIERWFQGYTRRYLRRSFHRVLVTGDPPRMPEGPVLVCLNHSSWWDLLLGFWLSREWLGWDGYAPMDERQLRRYPMLTRIGVFGVDRESLHGGRAFLEYSAGLLRERPRALWMTPQGAMISNDVRPLRFYSGIAALAQELGKVSLTTVALDYEFWDEKRPEAFVSFAPICSLEAGPGFSRKRLLRQLEESMGEQLDALDARRRRRDPSLFQVALESRGGISPAYDLLRRLRSQRDHAGFSPDHGSVSTPPRRGPARGG